MADEDETSMSEACHTPQHYEEEAENGKELATTNAGATLCPSRGSMKQAADVRTHAGPQLRTH
jgi:hypothetical protein